ncbi:M48 family metalloprotease [Sphingomonas sp. MMS12-HWE2-04]|uniref:M48 family metalloprotease n=1 Tax=Sphingomonas sp. MMS12-HWE2-04 TaxID=3234199 RepID=UPI00384DAE1F
MIRRRKTRWLFAAGLAVAGARPAAAQKAAVLPPYAGVYQPQGVDEIGLWREDDESERALAASPLVIRDETLTGYIKSVLCAAVGADRCGSVRIYVLREPTFNATMSPNGTMRVFSGLLLRVRNEAELAAVLGHEFGHFERRHSLAKFKAGRRGTDLLAWTGLLASIAPSYNGYRMYRNLEVSVYGSLFRYNRDQEREADRLGLGYLNQSSLPPQAAAMVWQNVMAELQASAAARGLRKPNFNSIAFTASHPPEGERAGYLAELADAEGASRDNGAARYRAALAPWLPLLLEDQIKLNDFGASDYLIQNLASDGWTADLWLARAELYRTRGTQRDFANAVQFYGNATGLDDGLPAAHRGLGLALIKSGRPSEGQAELQRYLQLSPEASDAKMIRLMIPGGICNEDWQSLGGAAGPAFGDRRGTGSERTQAASEGRSGHHRRFETHRHAAARLEPAERQYWQEYRALDAGRRAAQRSDLLWRDRSRQATGEGAAQEEGSAAQIPQGDLAR